MNLYKGKVNNNNDDTIIPQHYHLAQQQQEQQQNRVLKSNSNTNHITIQQEHHHHHHHHHLNHHQHYQQQKQHQEQQQQQLTITQHQQPHTVINRIQTDIGNCIRVWRLKHKKDKRKKGLHLRSIEEPQQTSNRMPSEQGGTGMGLDNLGSRPGVPLQLQMLPSTQQCYDAEYARMEAWMDENQEFVQDYFLRKGTRQVVDAWLVSHATSAGNDVVGSPTHGNGQNCSSRGGSGATTPVRKISAHEFERGGLLKPIVNTIDGTPTFLSVGTQNDCSANTLCGQPGVYHHNGGQYYRPQRLSRNELKQLDEKELIFELVKDICNELEIRSLCHKILQNVSILLNADRGSLFLVQGKCNGNDGPKKCLVSKLFDVCPRSTVEEMEQQEEVRVAWGTGIAGHVAESGEPVNIPDAYKDNRFNCEIDSITGYRTKALLCMPIKDSSGDVIGVAQVINKLDGDRFTENDEKVFASYLQFCGIGLRNAQLYEKSQLEVKRNQVLLDLARMIFEEQSTIEHMVFRILSHMQSLIQCQRVQILLVHEASKGSFSRVFDFEANDLSEEDSTSRTSPFESRFPINVGITGYVATTGETVNIPNAYEDDRFDPSVDDGQTFKHKSILCMAIKNSLGQIIGVIQLINKFDDLTFTKNDENFVEAFAIFCGMGIHNTHMYEKAIVAMAKQSVTLEVLSYHASASIDDAHRLRKLRVPSAAHFQLHDFKFDDITFDDDDTLKACLRMFLDLDFVERFHIDYEVLCRWLLSVKKNYRNVTYHNWRHAFNVAQMMFAILTATQWWNIFGEIECLALIIGCLCHDLDHRGTNNSFQIKASSPLAQLYSTSTMEHHHFDQCIMILNSPGNQILSNLSSEDYSRVIHVLEDAILSTDLAVYFRKRGPFLKYVEEKPMSYWAAEEPRALLRAMSMTVCDLSAITKPWDIEKRVADLVSSEFFEQGDMEKQELNITPIDIMNREKEDELPVMQVSFIESICLPIYEAFAHLSDKLEPLVEGVRDNCRHWVELASEVQNKTNIRNSADNSPTNGGGKEGEPEPEPEPDISQDSDNLSNEINSTTSNGPTPPTTGEEDSNPPSPVATVLKFPPKVMTATRSRILRNNATQAVKAKNCKNCELMRSNIRKTASFKGPANIEELMLAEKKSQNGTSFYGMSSPEHQEQQQEQQQQHQTESDKIPKIKLRVPSAAHFQLHDFKFDDITFDDDDTLKACLRMFLDLDFVERFHIDYEVLCRWLLSVKKNYRNVTYHNWRHAFNVAQMMFAILTATQWWNIFGEIECLALIIGCLCHDLDHRGTNNSFQIKASSPLAQLYSTSTMEHHHFDQCIMILNSPGNQILSNLSSEDYSRVIHVLEDAILSTDLAVYFRKRGPFLKYVEEKPMSYWAAEEPRALLRAMSMTVCDLSAITKPWDIEKRVADLVSSEFFEQGDMEKQELNITPIDIMNREKEDELPVMQVSFIESICLPIYEAFAHLSDKLEPLVEGVRDNCRHWVELASEVQNKTNIRNSADNSPTNGGGKEGEPEPEPEPDISQDSDNLSNEINSTTSNGPTPPTTGEEDSNPPSPVATVLKFPPKVMTATRSRILRNNATQAVKAKNCKNCELMRSNIRKTASFKGPANIEELMLAEKKSQNGTSFYGMSSPEHQEQQQEQQQQHQTESDKIPKIVGKLGNLDRQFFYTQTQPNGFISFEPNGQLHFTPCDLQRRRHSETNGCTPNTTTTIYEK